MNGWNKQKNNTRNNENSAAKGSSSAAMKVRSAQKKEKITAQDMFTRVCSSQLHVECIKEYRFYQPRRWRFDYAMPQYKVAVEVEGGVWTGGRHIRPKGFLGDVDKYNTAALLGWRVFRTTPGKLLSASFLLLLKNAISASFSAKNNEELITI